jgi:hypothetical protein
VQQQPLSGDAAHASNTLFYSFDERSPRYLDPTASYANPESAYTFQIYEPPYGYHYLKRPYTLVPKSAAEVVKPTYLDKDGKVLPDDAPPEQIAQSVYDVRIRPGMRCTSHIRPSPRTSRGAPATCNSVVSSSASAARRSTSSTRVRVNSSPRTSSTHSSDMPRRASRHLCSPSSPSTSSA